MGTNQYKTDRGQQILLVVTAINELGGFASKQETLGFIHKRGWIRIRPGQSRHYPLQNEPAIHTLLAYARKDAVIAGLLDGDEWNRWALLLRGRQALIQWITRFKAGEWDINACDLFTLSFRRHICSERALPPEKPLAPAMRHARGRRLAELLYGPDFD